jgi:uncharacterized protein YutE (UPF0331/DUF86 family)
MKYNGVILKKFTILDNEVTKLHSLEDLTTEKLDKDHFLKHGIERSLQICVEIIVDISQRILSLEGRQPAATSFDALKSLESLKIISSAEHYREMIQFRNFIVHRYERVDSSILISILNNHLDDFSSFRNEIAGT